MSLAFCKFVKHCAEQKDTQKKPKHSSHLWLCNTQSLKQLWMLDGQLDHFLDLLDLLVQAANHFIGGVWHLLHHHEGH